jgi:hypothetical protein
MAVAGLRQYLALGHSAARAERIQPRDLRRGQLRKHLRLAAAEGRFIRHALRIDLGAHVRKTSISSAKHQLQSSPGSKDEMIA